MIIRKKMERESCFVGSLPSLRAATSLFVGFSFFWGGGGRVGSVLPTLCTIQLQPRPSTPADSGDFMEL